MICNTKIARRVRQSNRRRKSQTVKQAHKGAAVKQVQEESDGQTGAGRVKTDRKMRRVKTDSWGRVMTDRQGRVKTDRQAGKGHDRQTDRRGRTLKSVTISVTIVTF